MENIELYGKIKAFLLRKGLVYYKAFIALLEENEKLRVELENLKQENEELRRKLQRSEGIEKKEKEKYGSALRQLFAWYLSLWREDPPEKYKHEKWNAIVGKNFKKALRLIGDTKKIMKEYEDFLYLYTKYRNGERVSKEEWRFWVKLFTDGSFTNFIAKLPLWKQYKQSYSASKDYIDEQLEKILREEGF